jgi:hypothetical protein
VGGRHPARSRQANIEWWYFDSILDDGAKLGMVFCTKDGSRHHQPLEPLIEFNLDLPDGRSFTKYARDGKVIADDAGKVTFSKTGSGIDEHTGKPMPDQSRYEYRDGEAGYILTYTRERTLVSEMNIDLVTGVKKLMAELVRYPGGYLRFSGPVSLDRCQGEEVIEHYEGTGSFEENFFGHKLHGDQ